MGAEDARLEELARRVHNESEMLAYPSAAWVEQLVVDGQPAYDVVIVGAGQSGLAIAQGLIRDGISNILLIDRNPEGLEGPWSTYARMSVLRTPKFQVGMDHGLPSLAVRTWYEAKYGTGSWDAVERVGREDWMDYLRWYRKVLRLPIRNNVEIVDVRPEDRWFRLSALTSHGSEVLNARRVILATGFEGGGEWRIPPEIAAAVPFERCMHSNTIIDFARFRGQRIGILGHGASSFDAALTALEHGAKSVDVCFRRAVLPTVNPHRCIEFVGFLKDFPELDDATRWSIGYYFETHDQPPARHSFEAVQAFANFALHAASPWLTVNMDGDVVRVRTPRRAFAFDYVICATGLAVDLTSRHELRSFAANIALWRDRYSPPPEERHDTLGLSPYLGRHYEFQEREPTAAPFLNRIHAFNFSGSVSMGPHSTSISGHKYSVPRLIRGVARSLFLEQQHRLMAALRAYQEREIEWSAAGRSESRQAAE
jgi:FAD-dependent urate hydroxylase